MTAGKTNRELATLTVRQSTTVPAWMEAQGVKWQQSLRATLHLSRTNGFFLGGGKALINTYYDTAARLGVEIRYDAMPRDLVCEDGAVRGVSLEYASRREDIACRAVVVATGGFEANIAWLKQYWGDAAEHFVIRGTGSSSVRRGRRPPRRTSAGQNRSR